MTSAQRYRSYLSETNAALFEQISKLCEDSPSSRNQLAEPGSAKNLNDGTSDREWKEASTYFHPDVLRKSMSTMALRDIRTGLQEQEQAEWKSEWREDVGQRYKELIPPKKKRSSPHLETGWRGSADATSSLRRTCSDLASSPAAAQTHETVFMLDLDKCTLFGNDGNDLGIALQWMDRGYDEVLDLYRLLVNPCVARTYQFLLSQYKAVRVVIYTMRATFLLYRSCFRDAIVPLQWHPEWHRDGQLYLPPHVRDADEVLASYSADGIPLLPEELVDLRKSVERLMAAREAVREALGLDAPPPVVVTATPKDVEATARRLGHPPGHAYLWDDNPRLRGSPRVVAVPPYDRLAPPQARALGAFLDARLPAESLDADLVDFMLGADPADRVLRESPATGRLEYHIPVGPERAEPWPVPAPPTLRAAGCCGPEPPVGASGEAAAAPAAAPAAASA